MTAISATMRFVKKYPIVLCGFSLLFMPTVHKLVIYFTPLLLSTAIFFLAMVSSGAASSTSSLSTSSSAYEESSKDADWLLEDQHKKELAAAMERNEKLLPQLSARLDHLARTASSNALLFHDCEDGDMMIEDSEIDNYMEMLRKQEPDPDLDTYDEGIRMRFCGQAEPDPDLSGESSKPHSSEPDPDLNDEKMALNEPDPDLNDETMALNEPDPDLNNQNKAINEPDPDLNGEKKSVNESDPDLNGENKPLNEPDPDLNGESMTNSKPDPDLTIESNYSQIDQKQGDNSSSHTILAMALERTLSCTLDHSKEDPHLQCGHRHHRKHSLHPLEATA